jgi:hypothetical protein
MKRKLKQMKTEKREDSGLVGWLILGQSSFGYSQIRDREEGGSRRRNQRNQVLIN